MEHAVTLEEAEGPIITRGPVALPYSPPDYGLNPGEQQPPPHPADIQAALWLLREAAKRGWLVSWRAYDPQHDAAASYDPPGPVCVGAVKAHDEYRTLAVTGIGVNDAVAQIREFFDWPEAAAPTTGDEA